MLDKRKNSVLHIYLPILLTLTYDWTTWVFKNGTAAAVAITPKLNQFFTIVGIALGHDPDESVEQSNLFSIFCDLQCPWRVATNIIEE